MVFEMANDGGSVVPMDEVALYKTTHPVKTFNSKCPVQRIRMSERSGTSYSNAIRKDQDELVRFNLANITLENVDQRYRLCFYDHSQEWVIDTGIELTIRSGWSLDQTELDPLALQPVMISEQVRSKAWAAYYLAEINIPADPTMQNEEMPSAPFVFREDDAVRLCTPSCPTVNQSLLYANPYGRPAEMVGSSGLVTTVDALLLSASAVSGEGLTATITANTDIAVVHTSVTTDGEGTGLELMYTASSTTAITSITVTAPGAGYRAGDKITIAHAAMAGRATDAVFTLVADDLAAAHAPALAGSAITSATDRVAAGTLYNALPATATTTVVVTKTNLIPFDNIHTILVTGNSEAPTPATVVVNSGYSYDLTAAVGKLLVSGWSTDKIRFYPKKDQSLTITESSVKESSNRFFDPLYDLIGFFRGGCPNSHSDWISKTLTASNSSSTLSAMGVETLTGGGTYTFDFSHVTDPFQYNMDFHICFYDKSQIVESATYVDLVYLFL